MRRFAAVSIAMALSMPASAAALNVGGPVPDFPLPLFTVTPVGSFEGPVALTARVGDDDLYVVEQRGTIRKLTEDGPSSDFVLDLRGQVSTGFELGLLGLAFSPDGNLMYIHYTDTQLRSRIVEYNFSGGEVDLDSRRDLLAVAQPFANHNCGTLKFGPDGHLYICMGDGGSAGDPQNQAQNMNSLLGKMLRIDPTPSVDLPYTVPPDNPFVGQAGVRPEIWAFGLRNPWKFSFDRDTGDLWIADVGQDLWEEVNLTPADSTGGENYGWPFMEGKQPYQGRPEPDDHYPPIYDYPHPIGCSITGGYVYRGSKIPTLQGTYLFGDFCGGRIWMLVEVEGTYVHVETGAAMPALSSFGEDNDGELYALSLAGPVFRLDPLVPLP